MNGINLYQVAMLGWVAALLMGAIFVLRARRNWGSIVMVVGGGLGLVAVPTMMVAGYLWNQALVASSHSYGPWMERYDTLLSIGPMILLIGIVLFGVGYLGFCIRYRQAAQRAAEMELLVTGLQSKLGDGR